MSNENRVNLSCTVPKEVKQALEKVAKYEEQTVSRLAAKAIRLYVEKLRSEKHPSINCK